MRRCLGFPRGGAGTGRILWSIGQNGNGSRRRFGSGSRLRSGRRPYLPVGPHYYIIVQLNGLTALMLLPSYLHRIKVISSLRSEKVIVIPGKIYRLNLLAHRREQIISLLCIVPFAVIIPELHKAVIRAKIHKFISVRRSSWRLIALFFRRIVVKMQFARKLSVQIYRNGNYAARTARRPS